MDTRKYMVIINGVIRTSEIKTCIYNSQTKKWDVLFMNNEKTYSYNFNNVEKLKNPEAMNPNMYSISKDGKEIKEIDAIYVFASNSRKYWHICLSNGKECDYKQDELEIRKSVLNSEQAQNVLAYIKQIAKLSQLKNEGTGEKLLAKRFDKIAFVGTDVALAKYLNPSLLGEKSSKKEFIPIFPFGCNNSQYKAVKNAMENQISVIQGPPGTGKTQTILNIIANILVQGKTVQVVSNNNTATKNVYEKLCSPKYNLGFIVATLGNAENKKEFIGTQNLEYPNFTNWILKQEQDITLKSIRDKSLQLKNVFDKKEEIALLKQTLADLATEAEYFSEYLNDTIGNNKLIITKRKLSSKKWMNLWQECQVLSEQNQNLSISHKIKNWIMYGITNFKFYKQDMSYVIARLQEMYYIAKCDEIKDRISMLETQLQGANAKLSDELCTESMMVLKHILAKKYVKKETRPQFSEDDLWKSPQKVMDEYPVILSTTFSARTSLNNDVIYDYLIMDEASQVDIATGALALSCARNVVIVGDTKQLPNVVPEDEKQQAKAIFESFQIHEGYQFTKSFLQSILDVLPNVTQTLLREHYRCHPKIIGFCNKKFYKDQLLIMTEDQGEEDVLAAVKTVHGNHSRGHYSQRQIDVIKEEVMSKYETNIQETGIISPYNDQVAALKKEFPDIEVATVHKFQGKEKDLIVISTVDDEISEFADDPYLINVAVSRAKKQLVLVVSGNTQNQEGNIMDLLSYIQYNNFEITESKIYSVFDYLYKQYEVERKAYLAKKKIVSDYDSENLMYALIEDVLSNDEYASLDMVCQFPLSMVLKDKELLNEREFKYVMNIATHLDFLIFNRISKKPILAIEVDGYDYHKEGTVQAGRDNLKDTILKKYEIPVLRFKTNGSREREAIINCLKSV